MTCAWVQAAYAEHANYTQRHSACVLYDLIKAYDSVKHEVLIACARRHGFNLCILRWLLTVYRGTRYVVVQRVVSSPMVACWSIVPGDSFADLCMLLMLLGPLDDLVMNVSGLHVAQLADDVQLLAIADSKAEAVEAIDHARGLFELYVEKQNRLAISSDKKKLVTLTSSKAIFNTLARRRTRLAGTAAKSTRYLGVDFACGGPTRSRQVQKKRLLTIKSRGKRLRNVRKAGIATQLFAKAGLQAGAAYGVHVVGMRSNDLAKLRTIMHTATVLHPSRSCTIDLELTKPCFDPTYYVRSGPVLAMLAALWDNLIPRGVLLRTLSTAVHSASTLTWDNVSGPIACAVLSLCSVGWTNVSLLKWQRPNGHIVDFSEHAPRTVGTFLEADIQLVLWSDVSQHREGYGLLRGRPWLEPVRQLLNCKPKSNWGKKEQSMLRCICADGLWPEWRLKCAGYQCDGLCVCGMPQTSKHIPWECPITLPYREQYGLSQQVGEHVQANPHDPVLSRCIMRHPQHLKSSPVMSECITWVSGGHFSGPTFGDGSGQHNVTHASLKC